MPTTDPRTSTSTTRRATPADASTVQTLMLEIAEHEGSGSEVVVR